MRDTHDLYIQRPRAVREEMASYGSVLNQQYLEEEALIERALGILERRMKEKEADGSVFVSPTEVKAYLRIRLHGLKYETFGLMLLDTRNRLIEAREIFRGTVDESAVYPREVIREVMSANANAVIAYHNHPSGNPSPSEADRILTGKLREALELIDIKILDHIVVAGLDAYSFAENGEEALA